MPWTVLVAFASTLIACLHNYNYIAVGNERSANYGNTMYQGVEVNHQFDKSIDAERLLAHYLERYVCPDVCYFSALQQWWDIQVAREFCQYKKYHNTFLSCNMHNDDGDWCLKCEKCAFVFIAMTSFLPMKRVKKVFHGRNLLKGRSMLPTFAALAGFRDHKPLECVGVEAESLLALYLTRERLTAAGKPLPRTLRELDVGKGKEYVWLLQDWNPHHRLPAWLLPYIPGRAKQECDDNTSGLQADLLRQLQIT